jgi:hypothetical protein
MVSQLYQTNDKINLNISIIPKIKMIFLNCREKQPLREIFKVDLLE